MDILTTSAVKPEVPPTVSTPLSVIAAPQVTNRLPPTVTVPRLRAVVPLSRVASPVAPVVAMLTAPDMTLVLFKVISSLAVLVVKLAVPEAVMTPESVMEPRSLSITMVPPKVVITVPNIRPPARLTLVRDIFPDAPVVDKETAPVNEDI